MRWASRGNVLRTTLLIKNALLRLEPWLFPSKLLSGLKSKSRSSLDATHSYRTSMRGCQCGRRKLRLPLSLHSSLEKGLISMASVSA